MAFRKAASSGMFNDYLTVGQIAAFSLAVGAAFYVPTKVAC